MRSHFKYVCMFKTKQKEFSVQVKNKQALKFGTCVYSWYTSPVVANKYYYFLGFLENIMFQTPMVCSMGSLGSNPARYLSRIIKMFEAVRVQSMLYLIYTGIYTVFNLYYD